MHSYGKQGIFYIYTTVHSTDQGHDHEHRLGKEHLQWVVVVVGGAGRDTCYRLDS